MNKKEQDLLWYYEGERREMIEFIPESTSVCMDVGCGVGKFGILLKRHLQCSEVWGVEIDEDAGRQAGELLDKVFVGDMENIIDDLPDDHFDCIIFNDSLEHMRDHMSILVKSRDKLKKNGVVVASIPNVRHYKNLYNLVFKKKWDYVDSGTLDRTHLRFFTESSIRNAFHDAGYVLEKIVGIGGTRKAKVRIIGWITFGWFNDIRYVQYACVARKI